MQGQPRCHHCGGHRITPKTQTAAASGTPYLMYKSPGGGFFDQGVRLMIDGCACLDCGHVMLFLNDHALHTARQQPSFTPWGE
jgi:hypothetical protein